MNLKHLTVSIIILFTSILNTSNVQEDKTALLCSGKWYMSHMESGETKKTIPEADKKNMWMIFSKDGKHEVNARNTNEKTEIGSWKFTKNKDSILFNTESGLLKKMKIKSLTKKELGLTFLESGYEVSVYLDKNE